jgi:hypothetical protein
MENQYESLTTLPLQSTQPSTQPTIVQNNYIHSLSPISQLTQIPLDSSYIYPTNLPISFPNTTPYYSNAIVQLDNCLPDQNSYSFTPYFANANSFSATSTSNNSMPRTLTSSTSMPSSNSRQQENRLYYYV